MAICDGPYSSEKHPILSSGTLICRSDLILPVAIRHLVIADASQCILGRDVTHSCNQLRINDTRIQFPLYKGVQDHLSIFEGDTRDYFMLDQIVNVLSSTSPPSPSVTVLAGHSISSSVLSSFRPLSKVTRNVNRVHEHVCGHASYGDMHTLLQRHCIRNNDVQKMLSSVVDRCSNFLASAPPPP